MYVYMCMCIRTPFVPALIRCFCYAFSKRENGDWRCAPLRASGGRGAYAPRGMRRGWRRRGCWWSFARDPLGYTRDAGQNTPQVSRPGDGTSQKAQRRSHQDLQAH